MTFLKRPLVLTVILGTGLLSTGCADDNLSKGLLVMAGAGAGVGIGAMASKGMGGSTLTGGMIGGIAGAGLGFLLGGSLGSGQKK